jgi:hypothetical protein
MFGSNGGLLRFIIGSPKYFKGFGGHVGPKPPPFGSNGRPTKIMSTSLGIFLCTK